jgi:hypothetical protein
LWLGIRMEKRINLRVGTLMVRSLAYRTISKLVCITPVYTGDSKQTLSIPLVCVRAIYAMGSNQLEQLVLVLADAGVQVGGHQPAGGVAAQLALADAEHGPAGAQVSQQGDGGHHSNSSRSSG